MWQFGGIIVPLLAGPCRVMAHTIWTTKTGEYSFDIVKGMLYLKYGITNFDKFYGYMINYVVYGFLYKALGWKTGFKEIDFFAKDVVCYEWNNGNPTRRSTNLTWTDGK